MNMDNDKSLSIKYIWKISDHFSVRSKIYHITKRLNYYLFFVITQKLAITQKYTIKDSIDFFEIFTIEILFFFNEKFLIFITQSYFFEVNKPFAKTQKSVWVETTPSEWNLPSVKSLWGVSVNNFVLSKCRLKYRFFIEFLIFHNQCFL